MRRFIPLFAALVVLASACHSGTTNAAANPFSTAAAPATASAATTATSGSPDATTLPSTSPTPPATPATPPPTHGAKSPTCVKGWVTPTPGTPQFTDPLGIIRRTDPVLGKFVVVDMRYFNGPESPVSDQGYLLDVSRWYIKLYDPKDLSYQGRFIVEERQFGRGLSAVAPYDTHGFVSPDWSGFQFTSEDTARRPYPGLPGAWAGLRYDFVQGGEGLTFRGLPSQVEGCLDGT